MAVRRGRHSKMDQSVSRSGRILRNEHLAMMLNTSSPPLWLAHEHLWSHWFNNLCFTAAASDLVGWLNHTHQLSWEDYCRGSLVAVQINEDVLLTADIALDIQSDNMLVARHGLVMRSINQMWSGMVKLGCTSDCNMWTCSIERTEAGRVLDNSYL